VKTEPRTTRLAAVDNLRVVLTALVVVHHVAVTYGNIPVWYYTEPAHDPSGTLLDIIVVLNQAFFMGFFFLISGYFTPGSHDRKGGRAFIRDRLTRLGIPLLAYVVLLRPLVTLHEYDARADAEPYWQFYLRTWDAGPMWFAEVLILFALLYALARALPWRRTASGGLQPVSRPAASRERGGSGGGGAPAGLSSILLFIAGLSVATILWRIPVPVGSYVPVLGLPSPYFLPQYAAMFAAGVVARRSGWFETLPRAAGRTGLLAAVLVSVVLLPLSAMTAGAVSSAITATWESAFAVSLVIGLAVLFRERFGRQGRRGRFLSEHAYTVYVVHPLVVVGLALGLRGLEAPAIVKFALVAAVSLPLCWGLAYLVRSLPGAGRVL
jgi:fucose 4-O-acetylase-like acetyltransferase